MIEVLGKHGVDANSGADQAWLACLEDDRSGQQAIQVGRRHQVGAEQFQELEPLGWRQAPDLVDEFGVFVFPVVVGPGKRLFGPDATPGSLRLVDTTSFATGVVANTYVRTGKLEYGAMGPEHGNW